ncbi:MAG: P1 family peptidase [Thermoleophilia bacterium]|nr:P1 family peptidase [Thermoleophilia bacterium]GIK77654.1 MAG: D-aminopeptidase [Actinomycetes bacterium]
MSGSRWRDLVGPVGRLPTGPRNAITDVPGVRVGQAQATSGQRTGVSVVAPPSLPAPAGTAVVNGVGELTAKLEIDERGRMETPAYLCGSHAIGTVLQAAITASGRGPEHIVLPVVGECDDGYMADSRTVVAADVESALADLGADVAEGTVGAGTGMHCFDFPGGIGTASRRVGDHVVGVLLLCNFGDRADLDVLEGVEGPDGPLADVPTRPAPHGSCIAICATDAPLSLQQLRRLALRPLLGLARAGSYGAEGSGEIGLAFGTDGGTDGGAGVSDAAINECFLAAFEAARESVYNCLVAARPARLLDGTMQPSFPIESIVAARRGRPAGAPPGLC